MGDIAGVDMLGEMQVFELHFTSHHIHSEDGGSRCTLTLSSVLLITMQVSMGTSGDSRSSLGEAVICRSYKFRNGEEKRLQGCRTENWSYRSIFYIWRGEQSRSSSPELATNFSQGPGPANLPLEALQPVVSARFVDRVPRFDSRLALL